MDYRVIGIVILPLLFALLVLLLLAWFVQRASKALAQVRQRAGFHRDATELASKIDATLQQLAGRVDQVRRQQVAPAEVHDELRQGLDTMATYLERARAIKAPAELAGTRSLIAQDIQRGARALEMVLHGVRLWSTVQGRRSELEAQMSIKRGYLNLLHARDDIAEHLDDLAKARDTRQGKWRTSRI
jgi:hypothetical protein